MPQPSFEELFQTYHNRNHELRGIVRQLYEFGYTIAREPSAAMSFGMDQHALGRQRKYVEYAKSMVDALHAKPVPDLPASHPTQFQVDLSVPYEQFVEDVNGNNIPINENTQMVAERWLLTAVELVKSQSSSIGGSLLEADYERAVNNLQTIAKLLDEIEKRPNLDLPETALPGAKKAVSGNSD